MTGRGPQAVCFYDGKKKLAQLGFIALLTVFVWSVIPSWAVQTAAADNVPAPKLLHKFLFGEDAHVVDAHLLRKENQIVFLYARTLNGKKMPDTYAGENRTYYVAFYDLKSGDPIKKHKIGIFRNPANIKLSPDGRHVAFINLNREHPVFDYNGGYRIQIYRLSDYTLRHSVDLSYLDEYVNWRNGHRATLEGFSPDGKYMTFKNDNPKADGEELHFLNMDSLQEDYVFGLDDVQTVHAITWRSMQLFYYSKDYESFSVDLAGGGKINYGWGGMSPTLKESRSLVAFEGQLRKSRTNSAYGIFLFNYATGQPVSVMPTPPNRNGRYPNIADVAFNDSGSKLFASYGDDGVRIFDTATGKLLRTFKLAGSANEMILLRDNKYAVIMLWDGEKPGHSIVNMTNGQTVRKLDDRFLGMRFYDRTANLMLTYGDSINMPYTKATTFYLWDMSPVQQ